MIEANPQASGTGQKLPHNEKLLALIKGEPGILSTTLRSRAGEMGLKRDAVSQTLYVLQKAGKIHYGSNATGQRRPCFVGPAEESLPSKGPSTLPEPKAPLAKAKVKLSARASAPPKKKTSTKVKAPPKDMTPKALSDAWRESSHYPVLTPAPVALPIRSEPAINQLSLFTPKSSNWGVDSVITDFASQLAAVIAQQVAEQVRQQIAPQVALQVANAVSAELANMTKSMQVPDLLRTLDISGAAVPKEQRVKARRETAEKRAKPGRPLKQDSRPPSDSRKKVMVVGLLPQFVAKVEKEFSGVINFAFAHAGESPARLRNLLAEADEVLALENTPGLSKLTAVRAHPKFTKVPPGLTGLRIKLRGLSAA